MTKERFEDRLLTELQQYAAEHTAVTPTTTLARRFTTQRPVRRLAIGGAVAAVLGCAGAAGVPALMGGDGTPAYAVDRRPDGTLVVHISEFRDPDGLARRLGQLGVPAHATYLPEGQSCAPHRYRWAPGGSARVTNSDVVPGDPTELTLPGPTGPPPAVVFTDLHPGATIVIHPDQLRPGESLVLVSRRFSYPARTPWPDMLTIERMYQHAGSDGGYGEPADGPRTSMLVHQPDGALMLGINIATGPVRGCDPAPRR